MKSIRCMLGFHDWDERDAKHRECTRPHCTARQAFYFLPGSGGQKGWMDEEYVKSLKADLVR